MNKKNKEYSKRILFWAMLIFCINLFCSLLFSWYGKDTSIFMYSIPTTGGIFGSAIVFYLNKAKLENVCKGKIQFFKFKMKWLEKHPEHQIQIENELSNIDSALTSKIDSEMEAAISEEITIQNY
jgi:hypothetical protein